jgi:FkbM family methyltransferase
MGLIANSLLQPRVLLEDLRLSLSTTRNWWALLPMLIWGKRERIQFRGWPMGDPVGYDDYVKVRDLLARGHMPSYEGGEVSVRLGKYSLVGGSQLGMVVHEVLYDAPYRRLNYHGKVVLDVGGFYGETAILFYALGASRVVVYEPVKENVRLIRENLRRNGLEAEVHEEGMGARDGTARVRYDIVTSSFGLRRVGSKEREMRLRGAEGILRSSVADIAKIDCEGYESALLGVPKDVIRLIPKYIVEAHSPSVRDSLVRKFRSAGYEVKGYKGRTNSFTTLICERRMLLGHS